MRYDCDMDSYITWPYQIPNHYCRITWVYNKVSSLDRCKAFKYTPSQDLLYFFFRLRYAQHIASGLAYAHSQCVVHLDIKPANILLSPDDTCKVADFGCCQVLERNTGMVSPTNRYQTVSYQFNFNLNQFK